MRENIPRHTKLFSRIAFGIVGAAIVAVLYITYLLLAPVNVLTVKEPLPASPTTVKAGDVVELTFDYCKHKDIESQIRIDYVGQAIVPTLSTIRNFKTGCHKETLPITIPDAAPSGEYYIHIEVTYQVNAIKERTYKFDSVRINVIQEEKQDVTPITPTN